jgi:predicted NUDIX family NTP pyrophosphohydrolase
MRKASAGILMYRFTDEGIAVLLVHPGGPFWRGRDLGAWSIPKGELNAGEEPEAAARREFAEELGSPPTGPSRPLGQLRQRGGKEVEAFAIEGDFDAAAARSNVISVEWPARSGRTVSFPEVDRAGWFALPLARRKILPSQLPFLDRLADAVGGPSEQPEDPGHRSPRAPNR